MLLILRWTVTMSVTTPRTTGATFLTDGPRRQSQELAREGRQQLRRRVVAPQRQQSARERAVKVASITQWVHVRHDHEHDGSRRKPMKGRNMLDYEWVSETKIARKASSSGESERLG